MSNEELDLLNEMKENCLKKGQYIDEKAKDKFNMLCHCEDFIIENYEQKQEIERLNNIINELEKELRDYFNRVERNKQYVDSFYSQAVYNDIQYILDKLQELKEEYYLMRNNASQLAELLDKKQKKNKKAIEYIEEHYNYENFMYLSDEDTDKLLEILKGE